MQIATTPRAPGALQLVAALSAGSLALLPIGLQPILLGALAEGGRMALEDFGLLAMAELLALGMGVVAARMGLSGTALRSVVLFAGLALISIDALSSMALPLVVLVLLRTAAGLVAGVLLWSTTAVLVRSEAPARVAGVFGVLQTVVQAMVGLLLALVVLPTWGWQGGFATLAVLSLPVCALAWWHPVQLCPLVQCADPPPGPSRPQSRPLLMAALQMACIGSVWSFLDPLGQRVGFDSAAIKSLVSLSLLAQVVGGVLASWLVRRWSLRPTLALGSLVLMVVAAALSRVDVGQSVTFTALSLLLGFVWLFLMPFHVALALRLDRSANTTELMPAAQLLGIALGPLCASWAISMQDPRTAMPVAALFAMAALPVIALCRADQAQSAPSETSA